ncbi:MAG: polysaccharide deacetylase family protein [Candidatus Riflebacteria bacterium]|nr:polysaccharide deacetylase family protein [Candidatus Riflebacteria bacterium]
MKRWVLMLVIVCLFSSVSYCFAADLSGDLEKYQKYYTTLGHFSDKAYQATDSSTSEYQEAYISGHFISSRLRDVSSEIRRKISESPETSIEAIKRFLEKDRSGKSFSMIKGFVDFNTKLLKDKGTPVDISKSISQYSSGTSMENQTIHCADTPRTGWIRVQQCDREGDFFVVKDSPLPENQTLKFVRTAPSVQATAIGLLKKGARYRILEEKDGWFRFDYVNISQSVNTISKPDFAPAPEVMDEINNSLFSNPSINMNMESLNGYGATPESVQNADSKGTGWVSGQHCVREGDSFTVKATSLNVRSGPSTEFAAVGKLNQGEKHRIIAEKDGWFQFEFSAAAPSDGGTPSQSSGYYKINIVKGNVPFLVQMDGFLKKGEIVLTFDDGPSGVSNRTSEICSLLKDSKAEAVFFVLGSTIEGAASRALLKVESDAGSNVAVHGYYHATKDGKPFTAIPWATISDHLTKTKNLIKAATGNDAVLFRPPYGIISKSDIQKIIGDFKLIPVGWTIDSLDWSIKSPDELYNKIISEIQKRGKGILLMHDIHPQSRSVVPRLLNWISANGYKVVGPERLLDGFNGR